MRIGMGSMSRSHGEIIAAVTAGGRTNVPLGCIAPVLGRAVGSMSRRRVVIAVARRVGIVSSAVATRRIDRRCGARIRRRFYLSIGPVLSPPSGRVAVSAAAAGAAAARGTGGIIAPPATTAAGGALVTTTAGEGRGGFPPLDVIGEGDLAG